MLNSLSEINKIDTVYHYCRTDSFLSIIKNKKLWLSSMDHLNDLWKRDCSYLNSKNLLMNLKIRKFINQLDAVSRLI
ncbi:Uncharacterised protein [Salmonella enterica subsp. enterica]|nr:Uncharacterised protein [Salmonella enterica subsp. enterica]